MLFEISLDYVVHNEFGNLILFNNNILETRPHPTVKTAQALETRDQRPELGCPSASLTHSHAHRPPNSQMLLQLCTGLRRGCPLS